MDKLHINNLTLNAYLGGIGEQEVPQKVEINLIIDLSLEKASYSDNIEDTIDWHVIKNECEMLLSNNKFVLVEALAEKLVLTVLAHNLAKAVLVEVKKLEVWDNGIPGVSIYRTKV